MYEGVCQDDPLSPLIFVLAADLLQDAVNDALRNGDLEHPIHPIGDQDFPIIQYADDTILVMKASVAQAQHMKNNLSAYADSVGLNINFQKSNLVPMNLTDNEANMLAGIFDCELGSMPFTYLGLPTGTIEPTINNLMPLVCKLEIILSSTLSMMSYGGSSR